MPSISAWFGLVRWPNVLIAAAGVAVGAWWARGAIDAAVGWTMAAASCITIAANVWNDVADVDIDRVAHPERPLPSGRIGLDAARRLGWTGAVLAVPFAFLANPGLALVTVPVLALARLYSPTLKDAGLVGNVVVAAIASLPFFYGGWAAERPVGGAALTLIAMPLHFAREVAKDLDDVAGDASRRRTVPLAHGVPAARRVVVGAALLFLAALAWPAARAPLFAIAVIPAVALATSAAAAAARGRRGSARLFKAAMVCAMVAAVAARP